MSAVLHPRWRTEIPDRLVNTKLVVRGDELVLRVGGEVRGLDVATGATLWSSDVNPKRTAGVFLYVSGDAVVTDRRSEPAGTTEVVVVRDRAIRGVYPLDCIVDTTATAIVDGTLYAIGSDPATGMVFRGVQLATGARVVDVSLADIGAAELASFDGRFVVGNRMASPGLYWIDRTGARGDVLEHLPSHFLQASQGRLMAALREVDLPKRTIQVRELATGRIAWSAAGFGPHLAIDGDDAVHLGAATGIVLRDAATGRARWHASVPQEPLSLRLAGPCVLTKHPEGFTVLARATGAVLGEIANGRGACGDGPYLHVIGVGFVASFEIA
jgi:outer membrane protein assembly factor BamB